MMLTPDYPLRALGAVVKSLAVTAFCCVAVPPAAIALGVIAIFERAMPQPAGRGPVRRDEF